MAYLILFIWHFWIIILIYLYADQKNAIYHHSMNLYPNYSGEA